VDNSFYSPGVAWATNYIIESSSGSGCKSGSRLEGRHAMTLDIGLVNKVGSKQATMVWLACKWPQHTLHARFTY